MKKTLIVASLMLLVAGLSVGVTLFYTGAFSPSVAAVAPDAGSAEGAPVAPAPPPGKAPIYISLDPSFTAAFPGGSAAQYMQIDLQVVTRDSGVEDALKTHMPAVRNALVMLFSSQKAEDLTTREGKEALRDKAADEIRGVLARNAVRGGIDAVLFTNFLMQ